MCTIIAKDHLIGKNYDSVVNGGMLFTNKRGLIKHAAAFPPDQPLEWVSAYGSITFSQSGKEMPACGINERGLVVEQATLSSAVYPEYEGKPVASCLEATQYLLDTCSTVEQTLKELERFSVAKSSWPIHFALFDSAGNVAIVEFLQGEKKICRGNTSELTVLTNTEYSTNTENGKDIECFRQENDTDCLSIEDMFCDLNKVRRKDTVWSNVYDLRERKLCLKSKEDSEVIVIVLDQFDLSPQSRSLMLDIKEKEACFKPYTEEANRLLISGFFNHPEIKRLMNLADSEAMIDFIVNKSKDYDIINETVLRFLNREQIKQLPVKEAHKQYLLKYLASKFEFEKDYSEGEVNAIIDDWHTFGDYFILRRELIESGLLRRLPNGSKYWRE